jgi:hypothetical protein
MPAIFNDRELKELHDVLVNCQKYGKRTCGPMPGQMVIVLQDLIQLRADARGFLAWQARLVELLAASQESMVHLLRNACRLGEWETGTDRDFVESIDFYPSIHQAQQLLDTIKKFLADVPRALYQDPRVEKPTATAPCPPAT